MESERRVASLEGGIHETNDSRPRRWPTGAERFKRVVGLNSQSPVGVQSGFFANGVKTDAVRGVIIGIIDVRQAVITTGAYSTGAAGNLPIYNSAAYGVTALDVNSLPDVWAFGGQNAGGTATNALFYTTHSLNGDGTPNYVWHAASATGGPAARTHGALAVNAAGTRVYLIGGLSGSTPLSDVWYYDIAGSAWHAVTLSAALTARYDTSIAVKGDALYVGGGVGAGTTYLGDLYRIDGTSGAVVAFGNVLPTGGSPDLAFDDHGDGLIFGGGYIGTTTYSDAWNVRLADTTASTAFVHDFATDGMGATQGYAVMGDEYHGMYWGVPGYAGTSNPGGVWYLQGATAHAIYPGKGGVGPLVVLGGSSQSTVPTTTSPHRATGRPTDDPTGVVITPGNSNAGPR